ncbi:MAG TPA: hypothetical protein VFY43_06130 [Candidatus Limnocylindria bacterium]|nr:hypothetical protein [Candidatus Limnocylindria bacterium]
MARSTRVAVLLGTLLILVAGSALATQVARPERSGVLAASHEPEAPPSAEDLAHAVDRLQMAGIDAGQLESLAAEYGLGGAVRLLAWAEATGMSVDQLRDLRDDGAGWGQMARDLGVSPGIGSIMGQGANAAAEHGPANAPGQQKPKPAHDDGDEASDSTGD